MPDSELMGERAQSDKRFPPADESYPIDVSLVAIPERLDAANAIFEQVAAQKPIRVRMYIDHEMVGLKRGLYIPFRRAWLARDEPDREYTCAHYEHVAHRMKHRTVLQDDAELSPNFVANAARIAKLVGSSTVVSCHWRVDAYRTLRQTIEQRIRGTKRGVLMPSKYQLTAMGLLMPIGLAERFVHQTDGWERGRLKPSTNDEHRLREWVRRIKLRTYAAVPTLVVHAADRESSWNADAAHSESIAIAEHTLEWSIAETNLPRKYRANMQNAHAVWPVLNLRD